MASSRGRTKTKVCSVDGCGKPWYCRVYCLIHYGAFRRMNEAARAAELAKPARTLPKWTYEGREDELIAAQEKNNE